jgi:LysR family transcriptional regulator, hypochlorite-specific transcription factor HypT
MAPGDVITDRALISCPDFEIIATHDITKTAGCGSSRAALVGLYVNMDIRWLQDFLTVAETGNFTRAAQMRDVSQAAFSRRIQTLEWWLGTTLIDRNSVPPRLTGDGELFREQAAEIVEQITNVRSCFGDPGIVRRKQVRIALVYSLASGGFPSWWNMWSDKIGPDLICSVITDNLHASVAALMTGSVDLLVCHRSPHVQIALPAGQYDQVVIGQEMLAPYASTPLAADLTRTFPGQKGSPLPLLMYTTKSSFARVVNMIIEKAPQKLLGRIVLRAETSSVLRAMAVAGHGIAWLPECVAKEAPPDTLKRVDSGNWSANLKIVAYRDSHAEFPALDRLWALLSSGQC